jgi:hypothetical protein
MNIPVNKTIFIRLSALVLGGIIFMFAVPVSKSVPSVRYDTSLAILVGIVLGFLIYQAAERRSKLLMTVTIELNKLRRIYHISKNLSEASQRLRPWFTEVHGNLYGYLTSFSDKKFEQYEETNDDFRGLTYHIYTIPELETPKEERLYDELLNTTAIVAASRQNIRELRDSRLSSYSWLVVLLMVVGLVVTVVLSTGETGPSRLAGAAILTTVLLAVDLLWEVDTLSAERKEIPKRYEQNLGRLELGRREK